MDDLKIVKDSVWDARAEWFDLGLQLGVNVPSLVAIQTKEKDNPDRCITPMLMEWLKQSNPPPTWSSLVAALRKPTVGQEHLADNVEHQYLSKDHKEPHSNTAIARLGKHSHQSNGEPSGTVIKKQKIESDSEKLEPKIGSNTSTMLGRHDTQHSDDEGPDVKRQKPKFNEE